MYTIEQSVYASDLEKTLNAKEAEGWQLISVLPRQLDFSNQSQKVILRTVDIVLHR